MAREKINLNVAKLKQIRKSIRDGVEKRRGYVFRDAGNPIVVRVSDTSIALYAEINGFKRPLGVRYLIEANEPILKNDIDAAINAVRGSTRSPKTRRQKVEEDRKREYDKRTYQDWYDEYCELVALHKDIRRFRDRQAYIENSFLRAPLPEDLRSIGKRTFAHIRPADLDSVAAGEWQESIIKKRGRHAARLTRTYVSSMFKYLVAKRPQYVGIQGLPPMGTLKVATSVRVNPLTDNQIKRIWDATEKLNPIQCNFVRFLMLTARRRGESEQLEWRDVDIDGGLITFRAETTKGGRDYLMPVTAHVSELLTTTPRVEGSPFVFSSPRRTAARSSNSKLLNRLDYIISGVPYTRAEFDAAGVKYKEPPRSRINKPFEWRFHDFRDTAADILQTRIGVDYLLSDQDVILGHDLSEGKGQRRAYNKFNMLPRKKVIFGRLENYIINVVEPERAAKKNGDAALPPELVSALDGLKGDKLEMVIATLNEMRDKQNAQT